MRKLRIERKKKEAANVEQLRTERKKEEPETQYQDSNTPPINELPMTPMTPTLDEIEIFTPALPVDNSKIVTPSIFEDTEIVTPPLPFASTESLTPSIFDDPMTPPIFDYNTLTPPTSPLASNEFDEEFEDTGDELDDTGDELDDYNDIGDLDDDEMDEFDDDDRSDSDSDSDEEEDDDDEEKVESIDSIKGETSQLPITRKTSKKSLTQEAPEAHSVGILKQHISVSVNNVATRDIGGHPCYTLIWEEGGSLGLRMKGDASTGLPIVTKYVGDGSVIGIHLVDIGDYLIQAGDTSTKNTVFKEMMAAMKEMPKPYRLVFQRASSEPRTVTPSNPSAMKSALALSIMKRIKEVEGEEIANLPPKARAMRGDHIVVKFSQGPLGITLAASKDSRCPQVTRISSTATHSPVGSIHEGYYLVQIGSYETGRNSFKANINELKNTSKPVLLHFIANYVSPLPPLNKENEYELSYGKKDAKLLSGFTLHANGKGNAAVADVAAITRKLKKQKIKSKIREGDLLIWIGDHCVEHLKCNEALCKLRETKRPFNLRFRKGPPRDNYVAVPVQVPASSRSRKPPISKPKSIPKAESSHENNPRRRLKPGALKTQSPGSPKSESIKGEQKATKNPVKGISRSGSPVPRSDNSSGRGHPSPGRHSSRSGRKEHERTTRMESPILPPTSKMEERNSIVRFSGGSRPSTIRPSTPISKRKKIIKITWKADSVLGFTMTSDAKFRPVVVCPNGKNPSAVILQKGDTLVAVNGTEMPAHISYDETMKFISKLKRPVELGFHRSDLGGEIKNEVTITYTKEVKKTLELNFQPNTDTRQPVLSGANFETQVGKLLSRGDILIRIGSTVTGITDGKGKTFSQSMEIYKTATLPIDLIFKKKKEKKPVAKSSSSSSSRVRKQ